jgi:hypothetical protein
MDNIGFAELLCSLSEILPSEQRPLCQDSVRSLFNHSDGRFSRVPEDFELPTATSLPNAWLMWHVGVEERGIVPLRALDPNDFLPSKPGKVQRHRLSEWKYIMNALTAQLTAEDGYDPVAFRSVDLRPQLNAIFRLAFKRLPKKEKIYKTRPEAWNVLSAARETREATKGLVRAAVDDDEVDDAPAPEPRAKRRASDSLKERPTKKRRVDAKHKETFA